eukprot:4555910-Amphidinium_carterae.1
MDIGSMTRRRLGVASWCLWEWPPGAHHLIRRSSAVSSCDSALATVYAAIGQSRLVAVPF